MCVKKVTIVVYMLGNVNAREGGADNRHLENGVFRNVSWHHSCCILLKTIAKVWFFFDTTK